MTCPSKLVNVLNDSNKMNQECLSCEAVVLNGDRFDISRRIVVFARCHVVTNQVGLLSLHCDSSRQIM